MGWPKLRLAEVRFAARAQSGMLKRPIGSMDESCSLGSLLRHNSRGQALVQAFTSAELRKRIECALTNNADDALSVLLVEFQARHDLTWLRDGTNVIALVERAAEAEAAECLLMLLNTVRAIEEEAAAAAAAEGADAEGAPTVSSVELLRVAERTLPAHDPQLWSEAYGRAFAVEDGGKLRCVRALRHVLRGGPLSRALWPLSKLRRGEAS